MRLLHISDWHLGRTTYRYSRAADHDSVLAETIGYATALQPHLIIHTGDVFDSFRPGYDEMRRGIDALQALARIAPVVVVAGNHDSPALFRLFNRLQGDDRRINFIDQARPPEEGGVLEFEGTGEEIIRLAPLPFVHANRMVERFEDPATWMTTYADRIHLIEDALARGLRDGYAPDRHILLFAAHLYVTGAHFSGSERALHVSDAYSTKLERLPQVSYAAFGHIHQPQALPGTTVHGRYAGSPICLDFGEEGEEKEIVIVEAEPGRPATVTPQAMSGGRPLRTLTGTIEEITAVAPTVGEAICRVTVRTEMPTDNLSEILRGLLPDATLVEVNEDCAATRIEIVEAAALGAQAEPSLRELFLTYLSERGTKGADAKRVHRRFEELLDAVSDGEPPRLTDLDRLLAKTAGK